MTTMPPTDGALTIIERWADRALTRVRDSDAGLLAEAELERVVAAGSKPGCVGDGATPLRRC